MVGFDHACNLEDELASGGGVGCRFLSLSEYEKLKDQVWAKQKLKKLTAESVFKAEKKKDRAEQVKQLTVESAKRESENTATCRTFDCVSAKQPACRAGMPRSRRGRLRLVCIRMYLVPLYYTVLPSETESSSCRAGLFTCVYESQMGQVSAQKP